MGIPRFRSLPALRGSQRLYSPAQKYEAARERTRVLLANERILRMQFCTVPNCLGIFVLA